MFPNLPRCLVRTTRFDLSHFFSSFHSHFSIRCTASSPFCSPHHGLLFGAPLLGTGTPQAAGGRGGRRGCAPGPWGGGFADVLLNSRVNRRTRRNMARVTQAYGVSPKPRWLGILEGQLWNLYRLLLSKWSFGYSDCLFTFVVVVTQGEPSDPLL